MAAPTSTLEDFPTLDSAAFTVSVSARRAAAAPARPNPPRSRISAMVALERTAPAYSAAMASPGEAPASTHDFPTLDSATFASTRLSGPSRPPRQSAQLAASLPLRPSPSTRSLVPATAMTLEDGPAFDALLTRLADMPLMSASSASSSDVSDYEELFGMSAASATASSICSYDGLEDSLRPTNPDYNVTHVVVPPRSAPEEYLKKVAHNVRAEYAGFLAESSVTTYTATVTRVEGGNNNNWEILSMQKTSAGTVPTAARRASGMDRLDEDAGGEDLAEFHLCVCVVQGRVSMLTCRFTSYDAPPELFLKLGQSWKGENEDLERVLRRDREVDSVGGGGYRTGGSRAFAGRPYEIAREVLDSSDDEEDMRSESSMDGNRLTVHVFGYIGDLIAEHDACSKLLKCKPHPLLISVANPQERRECDKYPGSELDIAKDGPLPINSSQLDALRRLRYDVEAIQGPPGTGKSTVIGHIITEVVPHGCDPEQEGIDVTLATCVQNKAVGAIAEKLAGTGTEPLVPFIICGNPKRLNEVAKRYTLKEQIKREPTVLAVEDRHSRIDEFLKTVRKHITTLRELGPLNSEERARRRAAEASRRFPGHAEKARARRTTWTRDLWALLWERYIEKRHAKTMLLQRSLTALSLRLSEEEKQTTQTALAAILGRTRAVLCTVATAAGTLRKEALAPLVQRIGMVVLDEAGTSPESKLPLLLTLPQLTRIVAIGDQEQLAPFTHWRPANRRNSRGSSPNGKSDVCHGFAADGHCRFGDACKYKHVQGTRGKRASSSAGACRQWQATGRCSYGTGCRFSHDAVSPSGLLEEEPPGFFQRLTVALPNGSVSQLLKQYRMHPKLCELVSQQFYSGNLRTSGDIARLRLTQDKFGLYFLNVAGGGSDCKGLEEKAGRGTINRSEIAAVLQLYKAMGPHPVKRSVLVIAFYRKQVEELRKAFERAGYAESAIPNQGLRIATVDQSQGSEADVVLISCVRSNDGHNIGFLTKPNRVNVAISRARSRLVLVGDKSTLVGASRSSSRAPSMWQTIRDACYPLTAASQLEPLVGV